MAVPTDVNSPLNAPSHTAEHQRVSDLLAAQAAPAWTNVVSFTNSWAQQGGFVTVGYRKINDIVYLRGSITKMSGTPGQSAFTLPAGFRPPAGLGVLELVTEAYSTGGVRIVGMVTIDNGGLVVPEQLGNMALNQIYFSLTL